jgi:hypothetical protein
MLIPLPIAPTLGARDRTQALWAVEHRPGER